MVAGGVEGEKKWNARPSECVLSRPNRKRRKKNLINQQTMIDFPQKNSSEQHREVYYQKIIQSKDEIITKLKAELD